MTKAWIVNAKSGSLAKTSSINIVPSMCGKSAGAGLRYECPGQK